MLVTITKKFSVAKGCAQTLLATTLKHNQIPRRFIERHDDYPDSLSKLKFIYDFNPQNTNSGVCRIYPPCCVLHVLNLFPTDPTVSGWRRGCENLWQTNISP